MSGGETEIDIIISSMFIRNTDTLIFSGSVEGGKKKKEEEEKWGTKKGFEIICYSKPNLEQDTVLFELRTVP